MTIGEEEYGKIRAMAVQKLSQRQIAQELNLSRKTVAKYYHGEVMPGTLRMTKKRGSPVQEAVQPIIAAALQYNETAPRKQKMTAQAVWQKAIGAGIDIAQSTVRKLMAEAKRGVTARIPLQFDPGEMMQVDWGDASVYLAGVKTDVSLFCAVLPFSYAIFCAAFPTKSTEAFFMGHVLAFEFFGGVPRFCVYDNLKTAVYSNHGKNAVPQQTFLTMAAHYGFQAKFCNIEAGREKGAVENLVGLVRRQSLVPLPHDLDWFSLQERLTNRCLEYMQQHRIRGRKTSVREDFAEEQRHLYPLPKTPFDPAGIRQPLVHPDCTIRILTNRYSVPCRYAGKNVTVKVKPFVIEVYAEGVCIATHTRSYEHNTCHYNPEHYLDLLEHRPRAILHAAPLKAGIWPPELLEFKRLYRGPDLNEQLVQILQLGQSCAKAQLLRAVELANASKAPSVAKVSHYLTRHQANLAEDDAYQVQVPDLTGYDDFFTGRED